MGDAFVSRCHVSTSQPHWFSQCEPACNLIGIKCDINTLQGLFRLEIVFSIRNWSQCYRKGIVQIFGSIAWLQIQNDINILKEKSKTDLTRLSQCKFLNSRKHLLNFIWIRWCSHSTLYSNYANCSLGAWKDKWAPRLLITGAIFYLSCCHLFNSNI